MSKSVLGTVRAALRTQLMAVMKTTVTDTLSCSGSSFYRTTGSFLTDGFRPGDELEAVGWGFTQTRYQITGVTDLSIAVSGTLSSLASSSRTLRVPLPFDRAWKQPGSFLPTVGTPFVRDRLALPIARGVSIGPKVRTRYEGTYFVDIFYPSESGTAALDGMGDAICHSFNPETRLDRDGLHVHVRGASRDGERFDGAWVFLPISIRLMVHVVHADLT